tara:strand:- start:1038 stop:3365 length:2328 start_codon:yes stop_codon:yes gene_type:complete
MADLRYTVDVDTRGAQQSITGLKSTLGGIAAAVAAAFSFRELATTTARFEDLRTTLKFLFRETGDGAQAFEQIKAFAKSSVFSVEDLTATVVKLKSAGLDPTIKQLSLFADVASVATDSVGALQAITDLFARTTEGGLGLEDLNRLADRGIPVFKILGDKLGLSRLEISKFGQTAEGAQIILGALTEGLEEMFAGASEERANNLSQAFSNLGDALGNAADAIGQGGFNQALGDAVRNISNFIERNEQLIASIGAGLGAAITFATDNFKFLAAIIGGVFAAKTAGLILTIAAATFEFAKGLRAAATAGAVLQGVTGIGLAKVAAGVAAAAGIIATIDNLTGDAANNIEELNKELEKIGEDSNMPEGPLIKPELDTSEINNFKDQFKDLKAKQDEITRSSIDYFKQYKNSVNDVKKKVEQEERYLTMTEAQVNVQRELDRFTQNYFNTIRPLQEKVLDLRKKNTEETKIQADEIEKQIGQITELYDVELAGLKEALELREKTRIEEESRLAILQNRRDLEEDLADSIKESQRSLNDLSLTPFQKEIEDIRRQIDDKLIQSIRNIKGQFEDGLISSDAYLNEIKVLEAEAEKAFEKITENARRQREVQRSFEFGWRKAFQNFADDATNAAKTAEKMFTQMSRGIEDTIVDFVKTGKLEFRGLIADMLETLLRSQIQQLMAQTLGAFSGGGGGASLSKLFAGFFANGGMIPSGSFGVVGERGPELVSGPATVMPMSGGGAVTYNINAVDALSFKSLIARDPGFIHAVATQGARKVPTRR